MRFTWNEMRYPRRILYHPCYLIIVMTHWIPPEPLSTESFHMNWDHPENVNSIAPIDTPSDTFVQREHGLVWLRTGRLRTELKTAASGSSREVFTANQCEPVPEHFFEPSVFQNRQTKNNHLQVLCLLGSSRLTNYLLLCSLVLVLGSWVLVQ